MSLYKAFKKAGLIGCLNGTRVTAKNCKRIAGGGMVSKDQIHNIIFNAIQALFNYIGDDFDKLVHLEDWIEEWIDKYLDENFEEYK